MKEAIEKILTVEGQFQEEMEEARRQVDALIAKAKKEALDMEEVYRKALEEKKKKDQEQLQKEIEAYRKELEASVSQYHGVCQKRMVSLRERLQSEIEKRLWEE